MTAPQFKQLRRAYGFDEVAIVPGDLTVNPDQTNIDFKVGDFVFSMPIIAAAMDAVTDVNFAVLMSKMGGLALLHLLFHESNRLLGDAEHQLGIGHVFG